MAVIRANLVATLVIVCLVGVLGTSVEGPQDEKRLVPCRRLNVIIPGIPANAPLCKSDEIPCVPTSLDAPLPGFGVTRCPEDAKDGTEKADDREEKVENRDEDAHAKDTAVTKTATKPKPVSKPAPSKGKIVSKPVKTPASPPTKGQQKKTTNTAPALKSNNKAKPVKEHTKASEYPSHVPYPPPILRAQGIYDIKDASKCDKAPSIDDKKGILKSKSDDRKYERFVLKNGLDVLLVSDNRTTKAAAAMDVNAGYWTDPKDIAGLAHFLEHMLFLGSKKFPKEDSYAAYLSNHGGSSNAFTAMGNTNFYFDVQPNSLKGALDQFSQFFISPLLSQSGTDREMRAVHAEHVKNLQSDSWRIFQLVQSLAVEDHPFHKFGTGNMDTLGSVSPPRLRAALKAHWKKYFTAPNLRLTIIGKEDIATLKKYAHTYFSAVPNHPHEKKVPVPKIYCDSAEKVFPPNQLPSFVYAQSVKKSRKLSLMWLLPPQTPFYQTKSLEYLSILLGGESPGSLLSVLKNKGLASRLTSGSDLSTHAFDLFQVSIDLTSKGFQPQNIREVMVEVFRYIKLIEQHGVEKWRWEEMAKISAVQFQLKDKEAAQSYSSTLSSNMGKYSHLDVLSGQFQYTKFDPIRIKTLLGHLQPSKVIAVLAAQKHHIKLNRKEKFYGTKFAVEPIRGVDLNVLGLARNQAMPKAEANPTPTTLRLPEKNRFIPKSLKLKPQPKETKADEKKHNASTPLPAFGVHAPPLVVKEVTDSKSPNTGSVRTWFKQDTTFKRPRVNVVCKLWTAGIYGTPRDVVMSSLYAKTVSDQLGELHYAATSAGFRFSLSSDVDGFDLRISGYDDGLVAFAASVSKYLTLLHGTNGTAAIPTKNAKGFAPHPVRFAMVREQLLESYRNFVYGQPHVHASYELSMLLESPHWHISQYLQSLIGVELQDVVSWANGIFQDMGVECLVHGNMLEKDSIAVVDALSKGFKFHSNSKADRSVSSQVQRVVQLDGAYQYRMATPNKDDMNSAVYVHYQYPGQGNLMDDVLVQLLARVMEKPCFHQLRTVEQLGYIVWSGLDIREGVDAIRVIVQSPKRPAEYLHKRVMAFMQKLRGILHKMPMKAFKQVISSMIKTKTQAPRKLAEETARHWYEVSTQQYMFDRRQREIKALRKVTKKAFLTFYDNLIGYTPTRTRRSRRGARKGRVPSMVSVQVTTQKHSKPSKKQKTKTKKAKKKKSSKKKTKSSKKTAKTTTKATKATKATKGGTKKGRTKPVKHHNRKKDEPLEASNGKETLVGPVVTTTVVTDPEKGFTKVTTTTSDKLPPNGKPTPSPPSGDKKTPPKGKKDNSAAEKDGVDFGSAQSAYDQDLAEFDKDAQLEDAFADSDAERESNKETDNHYYSSLMKQFDELAADSEHSLLEVSGTPGKVVKQNCDGSATEVETRKCRQVKSTEKPITAGKQNCDGTITETQSKKCDEKKKIEIAGKDGKFPSDKAKEEADKANNGKKSFVTPKYVKGLVAVPGHSKTHQGFQSSQGVISVPLPKPGVGANSSKKKPVTVEWPPKLHWGTPMFKDGSCNKSGRRKFYPPRPVTLDNIHTFKAALCLFPKRPVFTPLRKKGLKPITRA